MSLGALSGCSGAPSNPNPDGSGEYPTRCGARFGDTCGEDEYCDFPDNQCGAADVPGTCVVRPQACTREFNPTCGCDGETHSNPCVTHADGTDISNGVCAAMSP